MIAAGLKAATSLLSRHGPPPLPAHLARRGSDRAARRPGAAGRGDVPDRVPALLGVFGSRGFPISTQSSELCVARVVVWRTIGATPHHSRSVTFRYVCDKLEPFNRE